MKVKDAVKSFCGGSNKPQRDVIGGLARTARLVAERKSLTSVDAEYIAHNRGEQRGYLQELAGALACNARGMPPGERRDAVSLLAEMLPGLADSLASSGSACSCGWGMLNVVLDASEQDASLPALKAALAAVLAATKDGGKLTINLGYLSTLSAGMASSISCIVSRAAAGAVEYDSSCIQAELRSLSSSAVNTYGRFAASTAQFVLENSPLPYHAPAQELEIARRACIMGAALQFHPSTVPQYSIVGTDVPNLTSENSRAMRMYSAIMASAPQALANPIIMSHFQSSVGHVLVELYSKGAVTEFDHLDPEACVHARNAVTSYVDVCHGVVAAKKLLDPKAWEAACGAGFEFYVSKYEPLMFLLAELEQPGGVWAAQEPVELLGGTVSSANARLASLAASASHTLMSVHEAVHDISAALAAHCKQVVAEVAAAEQRAAAWHQAFAGRLDSFQASVQRQIAEGFARMEARLVQQVVAQALPGKENTGTSGFSITPPLKPHNDNHDAA